MDDPASSRRRLTRTIMRTLSAKTRKIYHETISLLCRLLTARMRFATFSRSIRRSSFVWPQSSSPIRNCRRQRQHSTANKNMNNADTTQYNIRQSAGDGRPRRLVPLLSAGRNDSSKEERWPFFFCSFLLLSTFHFVGSDPVRVLPRSTHLSPGTVPALRKM